MKKSNKDSGCYKPQVCGDPQRILLPPRFSAAAVVLLLLISAAVAFVLAQPQQEQVSKPQKSATLAPISRAEAAPVMVPVTTPAIDPRVEEVAALMPAETAEPLPASAKASPAVKAHQVSLSMRAKPQPLKALPPAQLEMLTARGIAYGREGNYDLAEQSLRGALALDRGNPAILYNLGVVAERRGDIDSARTMYEATLRQASERPETPVRPDLVAARLTALDALDTQER